MPDDGLKPLLNFIDNANQTLEVYLFHLNNAAIERKLVEAQRRQVAVRVLIEPSPARREKQAANVYKRLLAAGLQVRLASPRYKKTHAKTLVADRRLALITTMNFNSQWRTNRDYGVITAQATTVREIGRVFEADWEDRPYRPGSVKTSGVVTSPELSRLTITHLFQSASRSLYLEQDQFDDPALIELLCQRSLAGLDVQLIMSDNATNQPTAARLKRQSPTLKIWLQKQPRMHAKLVLADGCQMLIGSLNLTADSLDLRREIGLLIDKSAWIEQMTSLFETDKRGGGLA